MTPDNVIVFDLEWNGGQGDATLNEIFEIGAVKLERFGGPVVDTFQAFIRPVVHKKLNAAAQCFAPSEAELAAGGTFANVLEQFLAWGGKNSLYASWGPCDLKELSANASFWDMDVVLPDCVCDIQATASKMVGARNNTALHAMVEYCGVPDALDFHGALNDSFYTAVIAEIIFARIGEEGIWTQVALGPRGAATEELCPHTIQTGQQYGGFLKEQAVLNSKGIRNQHCPECGSQLLIICWFPIGEFSYMSRVSCPEHGHQFFFASVSKQKKGMWSGEVRTLQSGPAMKALYSTRDKLHVIQCKCSRRRKSKWCGWRRCQRQ